MRPHARTAWGLPAGVLLVALICACSTLGLAPAQSFQQRLAYAYGTHTAILQATASAQAAGTLTALEVKHVTAVADQARTGLDAARAVAATDASSAAGHLQAAVALLTELQTFLHARGASP